VLPEEVLEEASDNKDPNDTFEAVDADFDDVVRESVSFSVVIVITSSSPSLIVKLKEKGSGLVTLVLKLEN
jgi:hypothetical protein